MLHKNQLTGKKIVVLGGGGFIGGHLAKRLKEEGNHVRICDIKKHEYFFHSEICDEFILGDLTDPKVVEDSMTILPHISIKESTTFKVEYINLWLDLIINISFLKRC